MKTRFCKLIMVILLLSFVLSLGTAFQAKEPYASYYLSGNVAMKIPAPYEVVTVIDFPTTEEGRLKTPTDMFIGSDDKIYITDTGNNRVVVINPADENGLYTVDRIIQGTSTYAEGDMAALKDPSGIYVDDDGSIIVADQGNGRLVEYTKYGNFKYSYPTPSSDLLSSEFRYAPYRVTKDERGYLYVVNEADYNGVLMLDGDGTFRQYYGTNKVTLSLWESIARLLWNREDRKGSIVSLPYTFNNIFADDTYIYATTTTVTPPQVRKINAGGTDVTYADYNFADQALLNTRNALSQIFCDVTVDNYNNMLILDQRYGRIYEYDENGVNLFAFSSTGSGYGQLSLPCSIEVDSMGRIYVLNKSSGTITVFKTTEFADLIHEANAHYADGDYDRAFPIWQTVLDKDSYYTLALQNMGMIHMREEDYDTAINYFYDAMDAANASEAFIEIRAEFLRENFSIILSVIVLLLILWIVLLTIARKRKKKRGNLPPKENFFTPIRQFFGRLGGVIRHPVDTFEEIRYENKGSYADAFIIMVVYTIFSVVAEYCVSFIYRGGQPLEFINSWVTIGIAVLPWVVISIVNYGVTTIMYGEGRFRDVLIGGAYCHTPLLFLILPMSILTHALTLDEQSLYNLVFTIIYIWVGLLVFLCIKSVHGFHPVKAVVVFFMTAVGVLAVVLLFMIVYGLADQMFSFIFQFGKELSYLV
ncbi:MAG: YIP1 family protein [Clostridia bacterium]|nr:YIP1 family protein [Clostridia bacterium]